jgi:hypothetical protein
VSDNFVTLGSVAVLDPDNLIEGQVIEIDGQILLVKRIIGENVYLSPVTGRKLYAYHWSSLNWIGKLLAIAVPVGAIALALHFIL